MKHVWLVLLISISVKAGLAQQTLTLPDAINIALKNSLDIKLQKTNVQITSTNNYIGVAGGLPVVTGSATDNESVTSVRQTRNTGEKINGDNATGNSISAGVTGSML
ncbi:MAG TPA: hypothetical protein VLD19_09485, partial [Chitinophagaceae bacterium]|nr:hypothetical protein [Chitinophagaceae bacterium]